MQDRPGTAGGDSSCSQTVRAPYARFGVMYGGATRSPRSSREDLDSTIAGACPTTPQQRLTPASKGYSTWYIEAPWVRWRPRPGTKQLPLTDRAKMPRTAGPEGPRAAKTLIA